MSESVFCYACMATTNTEARYSNAGDRVCPDCESDFIELTETPAAAQQPPANDAPTDRSARRAERRNQGFHRHFTTPGGHNVHLHIVTSMGGLPQPLETLLSSAEPAQLTALLNNMQGMQGMPMPFNLPPGVSAADYGPSGGAAFDNLLQQLMEAHQPQASPTSRETLANLPRRKVGPAAGREVFSNTPTDLPASCGSGEPCSVCHDSMEENAEVVELPCQHCYHEDCITAWLKDASLLLQHNTCPVCRKELPVDEELRNQQQQSRQQAFHEEVQRQPAGLQSLFSQLNPFHLLGRTRNNAAAARRAGSNAASGTRNGTDPSAAALPIATAERLDSVRASLQQLRSRLQREQEAMEWASREWAAHEAQIEEAQDRLLQLEMSEDAAVDVLQMAQDSQMVQDARAFEDALEADQNDMPSLVSTDGEDSHEDDVTEADLPPSEYADASDDDDGMPALEPDPYNGASYPLQHAAVVGSGTGLDILQALLPGDVNGELFAEELASVEHPQDSQEESDMPPLIDFADRGGLDAIASGRNTPLDLDQQAALDNLSLTVEDAEDWCTEQEFHQDRQQSENSAPSSPQQASVPEPAQVASTSTQAQSEPNRRVVQRISSTSTPQNPAGPLHNSAGPLLRQPSGLALVTAADSMPESVQVNSLPVTQHSIDATQPVPSSGQRELTSHPLLPTPSRKRSFDPSEASSSIAGSPTAARAQQAAAAESHDGESHDSTGRHVQQGQQRGGGLLAPVTWAARGAGRLVGTILRRANSGRR